MRTLPVLLVLLIAGCGAASPGTTDRSAVVVTRPEIAAAAVLSAWDQRRAAAWATGSVEQLRALYLPGSLSGAADVRMLRTWRSRGLTVSGLTTQLLAVEVLYASADTMRLRVTDRVARATATGRVTPSDLPRDQPSAYVVVMVRRTAGWVVAEARNA